MEREDYARVVAIILLLASKKVNGRFVRVEC